MKARSSGEVTVIVSMPFESNAGLAHWSAEERRSMRNRLLVPANGLQGGSRAVRLAREKELGAHLLSLRRR